MANSIDRLTPLPPKLNNLLLELPENHLRQWGSWFLAISIPAPTQNWDQVLESITVIRMIFTARWRIPSTPT